ncbi:MULTISPECIES: ABC transporter permease [Arthrobacter]|uniref:ABC transporter permease n=1 Tax=Arthrobacter TaxID=1663 RepID=UPI001D15C4CA|nr:MULTISPECIES: ABC transporter permease [Arthrobacter]MCC3280814.1 ABC transporter permease [Arthrobacter caoxuetaonis]MCC9193022.1 ABC transporter permease [Arthrobacter sp. zg-Y916]USQ56243.1 ABC transporter permease [Arthrobacter caoxuetaonis]
MPWKVRGLLLVRDQGLIALWVGIIVIFSFWGAPHFLSLPTAVSVLNAAAIAGIYAAGVAVGVMTGVLDLSVPGTAAFAGVVTGTLLTQGSPTWLAVAAGLLAGLVVGVVNALVVLRGFNPLIVTIAMLSVLSGAALLLANGSNISGLTQLVFMGTQTYFGIPAPVYISVGVFVVLTVFLKYTRGGVRLLAVGGGAEAARRVGIAVNQYRILGFVISGVCAALGGIVTAAYITTAVPSASVGTVFTAMTAVALAGVPFVGGRGSLPRVGLGAVVVATISAGLLLAKVPADWSSVATGILLVGGLGLNMWTTNTTSKLLVANNGEGMKGGLR